MKRAIAFLLGICIPCVTAQSHDVLDLQHNPLAADLPLSVPHYPAAVSINTGSAARSTQANALSSGRRYTLTFKRPGFAAQSISTRNYAGVGQAKYFYLPQYGRRASIGLFNRSKPALAPMPMNYSPLFDPFYEEKELHRLVDDKTPFY